MKILFSLACICILGCSNPHSLSDEPHNAPARECEFERGSWCLLQGSYKVEFLGINNPPSNLWTISEDYWEDETVKIIEPLLCRDHPADIVKEISRQKKEVFKETWDEIVVRLKEDETCDLRILSPEKSKSLAIKNFLRAQIAICLKSNSYCEMDVLADHIIRQEVN